MIEANSIFEHVSDRYGIEHDEPFRDDGLWVFRHPDNGKWFALLIRLSNDKLRKVVGRDDVDGEYLLNLKVAPDDALVFSMLSDIIPAYHMSKKHWISIYIQGELPDELVWDLLDTSFQLTKKKTRKTNLSKELNK